MRHHYCHYCKAYYDCPAESGCLYPVDFPCPRHILRSEDEDKGRPEKESGSLILNSQPCPKDKGIQDESQKLS